MTKEFHIVYRPSSKDVFMRTGYIDFLSSESYLFVLDDNLSEGKIYDLKNMDGIDERINWFEKFYQKKDIFNWRKDHAYDVERLLKQISTEDSVFLWLGHEGNECVWKAAILNYFLDIVPKIYTIDWSQVSYLNYSHERQYLYSLYVIKPELVSIVAEKFTIVSENQRKYYAEFFKKLLKSNTDLRGLNSKYEIQEVDCTYFDNILVGSCKSDFQKSTSIIAKSFGVLLNDRYYPGIGEDFLVERLKQLCYEGILQMGNQENGAKNGDIFEVAIKS